MVPIEGMQSLVAISQRGHGLPGGHGCVRYGVGRTRTESRGALEGIRYYYPLALLLTPLVDEVSTQTPCRTK
jgi:hypothetical protein